MGLRQTYRDLAMNAIEDAKASEGQNEPAELIGYIPIIDARLGGSGYGTKEIG